MAEVPAAVSAVPPAQSHHTGLTQEKATPSWTQSPLTFRYATTGERRLKDLTHAYPFSWSRMATVSSMSLSAGLCRLRAQGLRRPAERQLRLQDIRQRRSSPDSAVHGLVGVCSLRAGTPVAARPYRSRHNAEGGL